MNLKQVEYETTAAFRNGTLTRIVEGEVYAEMCKSTAVNGWIAVIGFPWGPIVQRAGFAYPAVELPAWLRDGHRFYGPVREAAERLAVRVEKLMAGF